MPKKEIKQRIKKDNKAKILKDQKGNEHIVVIEEETFYSMTNTLPGNLYFTRSDGTSGKFEGYQTKTDITEKEHMALIKSKNFEMGWLVEENEDEEVTEESIYNKNSLSEHRIKELMKKYKNDPKKLERFIGEITSLHSLKRIKDAIIANDLPSSLVAFCDYKTSVVEEKELEKLKAPIDKEEE